MQDAPRERNQALQQAAGIALGILLAILLRVIFDTSIPWAVLLGMATVVVILLIIGLWRRR